METAFDAHSYLVHLVQSMDVRGFGGFAFWRSDSACIDAMQTLGIIWTKNGKGGEELCATSPCFFSFFSFLFLLSSPRFRQRTKSDWKSETRMKKIWEKIRVKSGKVEFSFLDRAIAIPRAIYDRGNTNRWIYSNRGGRGTRKYNLRTRTGKNEGNSVCFARPLLKISFLCLVLFE